MFYTSRLKTIELWFLLILPFFVPLSGICADADGNYTIVGVGFDSCGRYVQETRRGPSSSFPYRGWIGEYLTAVNLSTPNTYHIAGTTDLDGLMLWLENYCNKNPLKPFYNAVENLINELYPKRTTKKV